jgi:hypothetical protein
MEGTMKGPRLGLAALLLIGSLRAQAQEPRGKVLLYKDHLAAMFDTVSVVKNVLKLNPLLFLRGEIPLYYERALSPRLSAQVAIGMTWRNYINFNLGAEEVDDFGEGTNIIAKPSYHVGARYYFSDDIEPHGTYLELEFAHLDYWKDIAKKDTTQGNFGKLTGVFAEDRRAYNDLRLLFGVQSLSSTSNWLIDLYGGFGVRDRRMIIVEESINVTVPNKPIFSYSTKEVDDVVPVIFLGFRVGLGF